MKITASRVLLLALSVTTPAAAGSGRSTYDGSWSLHLFTERGACDREYSFDVNILDGLVSHPNLVRFKGSVTTKGVVHASVAVHDKFATGSGRLDGNSGRGTWTGRDANARCSGYWTAQRS